MSGRAITQVLAELELISHGSTQAWNSTGGKGEAERVMPPGELYPPHIAYRLLWEKATSDDARTTVRDEAEQHLAQLRGHGIDRTHVVGETREQEDRRIIAEGKDFTPEEVALRFHCTPSRVRRVRLTAGANVQTGKVTLAVVIDQGLVVRVRELRENGMSIRAIAMTLGRPKSTIHDLLADAA